MAIFDKNMPKNAVLKHKIAKKPVKNRRKPAFLAIFQQNS